MSVKIDALKTRVKYYGMFDFKQLYRDVRDKLTDLGYVKGDDYKYIEKYYYEKESSDPREGKTIWIWWRTSKKEESSTYYEQHIDLDFHLRFVKEMEIMVDNEKKRVWQAEIEVLLESYLLLDPKGEWDNHWFLKTVHPLFYKRIWRKRREDRKNSTMTDCYKVQAMVKETFEISHFMPLKAEPFFPKYGYKKDL